MLKKLGIIVFISILLINKSAQELLAQPDGYRFAHISTDDGLSNNQVRSIIKDSRGFIWIGTLGGLSRFDGHKFKIFERQPFDTTSLLDNAITSLTEDGEGNIWIRSYNGICKFDPKSERFSRYTSFVKLGKESIHFNDILSIFSDDQGRTFFSTRYNGIIIHDTSTNSHKQITRFHGDTALKINSPVSNFSQDEDGNIWIAHYNGVIEKVDRDFKLILRKNVYEGHEKELNNFFLIYPDSEGDVWIYTSEAPMPLAWFKPSTGKIEFIQEGSSALSANSDLFSSVVEGGDGKIWVGTDHGGINIINKKTRTVEYISSDNKEQSLSQSSITTMCRDQDGIIWIGTYKQGVNFYHEKLFLFNSYLNDPSNPNSLIYNDVNCFCEDEKGNILIGTNGGGINHFNRNTNKFTSIKNDKSNPSSLSNDVVVSLLKDSRGIVWAGTYYGGLNKYENGKFERYMHDKQNPRSLSDNRVWKIFEDSKQNLWIGTLGGGLLLYDRKHNAFLNYSGNDSTSVQSDFILTINEDSYGNLWVGTGDGVYVIYWSTGDVVHFSHSESNPKTLSNNLITTIAPDDHGRMWVGTRDGLNLFNPFDTSFIKFRTENGLPNNTILSLVKDLEGNLWLATSKGISRLSIDYSDDNSILRHAVVNYDKDNGIVGQGFNERSAFLTSQGEVVFGGSSGFYLFQPENIKEAEIKSPVYIVGFELHGEPLEVIDKNTKRSILKESLLYTEEITLDYSDNIFSIEFAALAFLNAEKISYRYKLVGFNEQWLNTDYSERKVTYTNLDPGSYKFSVQAYIEGTGDIVNEASLALIIKPPFWRSKLALVVYIIIVLGSLIVFRQVLLMKERLKFQNEQAKLETQRQQELNTIKTRFFTNVSHEFRTPLTLIISPLERLKKKYNDKSISSELDVIFSNAKRLLGLVNQLLDFRKMEEQRLTINLDYGNVVIFIHEVFKSFTDLAQSREIEFKFKSFAEKFFMRFDEDKLEKVLFNLLSNAFKFTNKGGKIEVILNLIEGCDLKNRLNTGQDTLEIIVSDTGIGIPEDSKDKIFERFFQNDQPTGLLSKGSGVGLSLTQEFIKLHNGVISVESELDKGSRFFVCLPVDQERLEVNYRREKGEEDVQSSFNGPNTTDLEEKANSSTILLVEDNEDFRFYLRDNLRINYKILEASDGSEALTIIHDHLPDLIVSDLMMPKTNGIELCEKIKADEKTSHIPFILLTASLTKDLEIQGFKAGTDAYITKPFSFEILESRIRNLLLRRERMKKSYQKTFKIEPGAIGITSLDEKLMNKALKFVEDSLMDTDLSVEKLSSELGFSRVHLYKKMSSITGKTPVEFIRLVRLKRASQLLRESQLTVSEIAYQVGFTDPRYFSKIFKAEYKQLPSQYKANHSKSTSYK